LADFFVGYKLEGKDTIGIDIEYGVKKKSV
jgi:hypothetical protein